ncbi:MAG TPA: carboxypeptidase regulatory-like domain-containing protein [Polyangia bacterium]|nr:carboxypeptidase regulatory-like domain-containing protein [Polyangia bacterium]
MQLSTKLVLSITVTSLALGGMLISCGPANGAGHGGGGSGADGGGGSGASNGGGGSGGAGNPNCVNLQCQQMACPGGGTTTLTGKVFAPNGTLPLYNAIVYVPNSTPAAFTDGVTCDRCNGSVSGNPVVQTLTDSSGSFTLTDVPVGNNIPLVIQLGKWRRQVSIPTVPQCASTPLDAGLTTLPKDHTEGDMPKMAIVTGSADPLECLLLKVGISPSEITEPGGAGRIAFYKGHNSPGTTMSNNTPDGTMLYGSQAELMKYDVLLLPCEGGEYDQSAGTANVASYVNAGGRVFTTHYSYDWWSYTGSQFLKVAKTLKNGLWPVGQKDYYNDTIAGALDTAFPKGAAFAQWLIAAGATSPVNTLNIVQGRHDVTDVDPKYAQDWINYNFNTAPQGATNVMGGPGVMHFTFNTPLDAPPDDMGMPQYCGRAVFSDFHVTADALQMGQSTFPGACKSAPLTDQEKALAFMLFDLSSCVQSDQSGPIP